MRSWPFILGFCLITLSMSALAADGTYEVTKTDATGPLGSPLKASVQVTAKQGWHLNKDAPLTLKLTKVPGIDTPKTKLVRADLAQSSESAARFEVPFTTTEAGSKSVEAEAGFVLCQDTACRPIREKVTLRVDATAPSKGKPAKKS